MYHTKVYNQEGKFLGIGTVPYTYSVGIEYYWLLYINYKLYEVCQYEPQVYYDDETGEPYQCSCDPFTRIIAEYINCPEWEPTIPQMEIENKLIIKL